MIRWTLTISLSFIVTNLNLSWEVTEPRLWQSDQKTEGPLPDVSSGPPVDLSPLISQSSDQPLLDLSSIDSDASTQLHDTVSPSSGKIPPQPPTTPQDKPPTTPHDNPFLFLDRQSTWLNDHTEPFLQTTLSEQAEKRSDQSSAQLYKPTKLLPDTPSTAPPQPQRLKCEYGTTCILEQNVCICNRCMVYWDCCPDFSLTFTGTNSLQYSCRELAKVNIWMVSDCPQSYMDRDVVRKCRDYSTESGDPYQIIPVYSRDQQFFQNRYCAVCNNVSISTDLYPIGLEVTGFLDGCSLKQSRSEAEFLLNVMEHPNCSLQFSGSDNYAKRLCAPGPMKYCRFILDSFSKDFPDCNNGPFAPVITKDGTFRETPCMKCYNFSTVSKTNCRKFSSVDTGELHIKLLPLKVILNVNVAQVVEHANPLHCSTDEIFDPLKKQCRQIHCGGESVYKNGQCVQLVRGVGNVLFNATASFEVSRSSIEPGEILRILQEDFVPVVFPSHSFFVVSNFINNTHQQSNCSVFKYVAQFIYMKNVSRQSELIQNKYIKFFSNENWATMRLIPNWGITYINMINSDNRRCLQNKKPGNENPNIEIDYSLLDDRIKCPYVKLQKEEMDFLEIDEDKIVSNTSLNIKIYYTVCLDKYLEGQRKKTSTFWIALDTILTYGSFGFSCLCGFCFLVVFAFIPSMRTVPTYTITNLVVCTVLVQVTYVIGIGVIEFQTWCKVMGVIIHYLWLCNFTWSAICAVHMWRVFKRIRVKVAALSISTLYRYMVIGYGLPALYTSVFLIGDYCDCFPLDVQYGGEVCFLNSNDVILFALDMPVFLCLVSNITFFLLVARIIANQSALQNYKTSRERRIFLICTRIASALNLSWIIGFVAKWTNLHVLLSLFTLINGLQGTFLLLAFVSWTNVITVLSCKGESRNEQGNH